MLQKFYPQSTTNKENKPIEFEQKRQSNMSIENTSNNTSANKYSHKSYNYHSNYVQSSVKTPSGNQNLSIKYQVLPKGNAKAPKPLVISQ